MFNIIFLSIILILLRISFFTFFLIAFLEGYLFFDSYLLFISLIFIRFFGKKGNRKEGNRKKINPRTLIVDENSSMAQIDIKLDWLCKHRPANEILDYLKVNNIVYPFLTRNFGMFNLKGLRIAVHGTFSYRFFEDDDVGFPRYWLVDTFLLFNKRFWPELFASIRGNLMTVSKLPFIWYFRSDMDDKIGRKIYGGAIGYKFFHFEIRNILTKSHHDKYVVINGQIFLLDPNLVNLTIEELTDLVNKGYVRYVKTTLVVNPENGYYSFCALEICNNVKPLVYQDLDKLGELKVGSTLGINAITKLNLREFELEKLYNEMVTSNDLVQLSQPIMYKGILYFYEIKIIVQKNNEYFYYNFAMYRLSENVQCLSHAALIQKVCNNEVRTIDLHTVMINKFGNRNVFLWCALEIV